MKHVILTLAILLPLAAPTAGDAQTRCFSSERFGNALVRVGDSERKVIEADPDRTVRLETSEGGAAGYRHEFYKRNRTVQVYVRAGQVTRICSIREL